MKLTSYKQLIIWSKAMELCKLVYLASSELPQTEQYGLISQIRRAAVSAVSNVAEGYSRKTTKDFCRFLNMSYASLAELETQILIIVELKLASKETWVEQMRLIDETRAMIFKLTQKLEKRL